MMERESLVILRAAGACITGHGCTPEGALHDTFYNEKRGVICCFGESAVVTFTVPKDVDGRYDLYAELGRLQNLGFYEGNTPIRFSINDGAGITPPLSLQTAERDESGLYETSPHLLKKNVTLRGGDRLELFGEEGFTIRYGNLHISCMPSCVGDLLLKRESVEDAAAKETEERRKDSSDLLSGRRILWLGSSVTAGMKSDGYTMAEAIADRHAGTVCEKFTLCGTTLCNNGTTSYGERLKQVDPDLSPDLFIVQLSTNDANQKMPLGCVSEDENRNRFDDSTVIGAMETIISYIQKTFCCPVAFYTGTWFNSDLYGQMVGSLSELQRKWRIEVIDLWNNEEMRSLIGTDRYHSYMSDPVHPNRDGYVLWWTPYFEKRLTEIFQDLTGRQDANRS